MSLLVVLPFLSLLLHLLFISCKSSPPCLASYQCGNITMKYPFSLYTPLIQQNPYDRTQNQNQIISSYCGYPGLSFSCQNKTAFLHLQNDKYTILSIDYVTSIVTVADTDILNSDSSCLGVNHNVSFTSYDWIRFTNLDINLIFFYNCSSINFPTNSLITCFPDNSYVIPVKIEADPNDYYYLSNTCEEMVLAPALNNSNDLDVLNADFDDHLKNGFQLQWHKGLGNCTECEAKGGQCGYNLTSDSTFLESCFCAGGMCAVNTQTNSTHKNKNNTNSTTSTQTEIKKPGLTFIEKKKPRLKRIIIGISIGVGGLLALCMLACLFFWRKDWMIWLTELNERDKTLNVEATLALPKMYKFSEIKKMTKSFSEKLGQGGYGTVFKGKLIDGTLVAVKVLKDRESNGEEFINEVASIARTSHVNIVKTLGFSMKGSNRALIYEFMPNGSLDKYLHERKNVTMNQAEFERLFEITIGIARGLEYLHRGCNTRIVHFDIKPHNILLDLDYCPKISDFGLAKLCRPKESKISMSGMRGTIGYIAPEVFSRNFGAISSKSDVYSYGMMVLEMLGEKQNKRTETTESSSETYFPDNIYKYLEENTISSVYGLSDVNEEIVRKMAIVGLWCIQVLPDARPTMSRVLEMLEGSVEDLSIPQKLNLSLTPQHITDSSSTELQLHDNICPIN